MTETKNGLFVIRKDVPIPIIGRPHAGITGVMSRLEVGDCVDLPLATSRVTLYSTSKRLKIKVTVRRQREFSGDFLRMWRIK